MSNQKSLKMNFIMNAILTMSAFIFPLITFPYVSRILLPLGTGKVSFATSFVSYFNIFAQLGIPTYGIRACAIVRDDKEKLTRTVQELFFINIFMTVIAYIGFILALIFVPRLQDDKILYVIISMSLFFNTIGMEWLYKALEQYTYITVRSIVFKFIALIAMFLLVHQQSDYIIYGAITILAASASNVFNFINVHRFISLRPIGDYNFIKHLKPVFVFFAMACATTIYTNLDTVMLGFMKTDVDVGYYNAAVKIKDILISIVTSLGAVLLPRCSYYVEHGLMDEFKRVCTKAIHFVFVLAVPMAVYFILFAVNGIYFLSGEAYSGSILPMQVIMFTILFVGLSNITGIQILIPLGKENVVLQSEIVGAIVDLVINYFLIPKLGATGAAIGTLIAEFVVLGYQFIALKDEVASIFTEFPYVKIIVAIILAIISSFWIRLLGLSNFITLVISASIFFMVYGVVLLVLKMDIIVEIKNMFFNLLKSKLRRS